jgi:plasmid stabilization system protein ParE
VVEVVFLPAADADYRQALAWYQGRSAQAAAGFEAAVEVALRAIAEAPERWTACDERHRFYTLRRYPYSIYYRVEAAGALIVAVAHTGRSDSFWRGRG